jgi:hypothetical protein
MSDIMFLDILGDFLEQSYYIALMCENAMENNLSKRYVTTAIVATALVSMLMLVPTDALAQGAGLNFKEGPNCTIAPNTFVIRCTGSVSGAGTGAVAKIEATASVTSGCINPGSKDQQPSGLRTTTQQLTGSQPLPTATGGSTPFYVSSNAVTGRTCPRMITE